MEEFTKLDLGYSSKNITIGSRRQVRSILISQTAKFIRNVRWKAWFYLHPEARNTDKDTFGFKSNNNPPTVPELRDFENRIIEMVEHVEFKESSGNKSDFQYKMEQDLKNIKSLQMLTIEADKTTNSYQISLFK